MDRFSNSSNVSIICPTLPIPCKLHLRYDSTENVSQSKAADLCANFLLERRAHSALLALVRSVSTYEETEKSLRGSMIPHGVHATIGGNVGCYKRSIARERTLDRNTGGPIKNRAESKVPGETLRLSPTYGAQIVG